MKKLFMLLALFAFSIILNAQTTVFVLADTCGNDEEKTGIIDLRQFSPAIIDSIKLNVFASGELDIDSIGILGGFVLPSVAYPNGTSFPLFDLKNKFEHIDPGSGTLTINVADGVEIMVQEALTVSKANLDGYNQLKVLIIGAAAGCDATDDDQKVLIFATVYTSPGT